MNISKKDALLDIAILIAICVLLHELYSLHLSISKISPQKSDILFVVIFTITLITAVATRYVRRRIITHISKDHTLLSEFLAITNKRPYFSLSNSFLIYFCLKKTSSPELHQLSKILLVAIIVWVPLIIGLLGTVLLISR